jgi:clan AA aspartic protease
MSITLKKPRTDRLVDGKRRIYPDEAEGIEMGDVWVDVKLTNATDEILMRTGQKTLDQVRSLQIEALVDTGAVKCVMPESIADKLGLGRSRTRKVMLADGSSHEVPSSDPVLLEIMGRQVYEEFYVFGNEVLIGQTALESTDLFVDCNGRRVVPNPDHPGQAIIRIY